MRMRNTVPASERCIKGRSRGFTLIELLVVIAIIALLVSILMPSLNRAKDLAKDAVCANNVRTIGLAEVLYAGEYEGHLTITATYWDRPSGQECLVDVHPWEQTRGILWYETLFWGGYIPSLRLFEDPADTNEAMNPDLASVSYGFNAYLGRGGNDHQIDNVVSPQWTILITPNNPAKPSHTGIWNYARPDAHRHAGYRAFYSFCDGHAEAISFEKMFGVEYRPDWSYAEHWVAARPDMAETWVNGWSNDMTAEQFDHWAPWRLGGEFNQWGNK